VPSSEVKRCRLLGMNWKSPRVLLIDSGPAYQTVAYSRLRSVEVDRRERWTVGAVRQLAGLRRRYRADPLGPSRIVELRQTAGTVEDEVILKRHVADGNAFLRDERQVAVCPTDGKQTRETCVDVRRSEPMKMRVIPEHPLRHVPGEVVGVGVGHPWGDVQHHVVGVSPRTNVSPVGVEVDRRRGHLLRVDRDGLAVRRVLRTEVIADGQAGEAVLEMDDQPFAGKHMQRRRRIKIAARLPSVRRRAADHLIVEQKKVLHGCGDRIEVGLALPRGEPNFEDAVLALQRHRLAEFRSSGGIRSSLGGLCPGTDAGTRDRRQHGERSDCQRAQQPACTARAVE
jgi:hypothetical protein